MTAGLYSAGETLRFDRRWYFVEGTQGFSSDTQSISELGLILFVKIASLRSQY